ncbi:hypothetical protein [Halovulum marinum]|uniref:hypothetical protein n=1 Tax=Halovulum marinum TaxID=2662447 RepID=UPI001F41A9D9|nr:hypothetical protein [Halovulum marinum]
MIPLIAFAAGFAFGWLRARRRGGNRLDKLQYGAGHGIFAAILALAAVILAARLA